MQQEPVIEVQLNPPPPQLQFLGFPLSQLAVLFVVVFVLVYMSLRKKKNKNKNSIVLIGERFAGKTQTFISLAGGKRLPTVPSIKKNQTTYKLHEKSYSLIDYNGDNLSREEIIASIDSIYCIIHVIDGTNTYTFGDEAMFLYRVLVNKAYQRDNCHYIIFLNKKDSQKFIGIEKAKNLLEDQIEHIKTARIYRGQQLEGQEDYIKLSKGRFKLPIKIIAGSAETNFKELQGAIESL